jgi:hypothetical protein
MQARGNRKAVKESPPQSHRFQLAPASSTAFVISSTNNGMPSVRSMMSF